MKIVFMLFLVLIASKSMAKSTISPVKVISQVCGYKYVQGVKRERPNGQLVRECLNKNFLPEQYSTDVHSKCYKTHTEGVWIRSSNGFDSKVCSLTESLDNFYPTYETNTCAKGYSTNGVASHPLFDYSFVMCVKN